MSSGAAKPDTEYAGVVQTLRELPTSARFVLLGVFINQFGAFLQFFLVLYLTNRNFSLGQAGLALGAYSAGAIVGTLFGGAMSDRLGARWTIVLSVGAAALFTLSITTLDNFVAIVVAVALAGAMTQSARPAVASLLFAMVPPARQVMVMALYRTALNSGVIAGPAVAVWLSTISWDLVFYFDAASALTYAAIAAFLLPKNGDRSHAAAAGGTTAEPAARKAGYLVLLRDTRYLAYLALMLGNGLVHVQFFAVLPLMLADDTWVYALASMVSAAVVISSEVLVTQVTQKWAAWIAVIAGWLLLIVGRGMFGLPGGSAVIFAGVLLAAVGQVIGGPAAFAYPAKVAPPGATGRYVGSAHSMFTLGYTLGPLIGIMLWSRIGNVFWGLLFAFGLVITLVGIWGMRPDRTPAAPAADQPDEQPDDRPAQAPTTAAAGPATAASAGPGAAPDPDRQPGADELDPARTPVLPTPVTTETTAAKPAG